MNVVNSGAAVGYQTHFDSVWICSAWVQVGKSLGSGLHPAYKELYLTVCRPNTCPSSQQLLLKVQRWSWLSREGSFSSVPHPSAVSWCPLAGAGARAAPVPWLVHTCVGSSQ